ncbi:MAG TPA: efflux RND transporter periplasmic adaptor subunit [Bacillales bacterium]|nr:efflux RND transporter periplasmic adaptor subunit [Bacillales bacterium]
MLEEETKQGRKKIWTRLLAWTGIVLFIAATLAANIYQQRTSVAYAPESLKTMTVQTRTMNKTLIASGEVQPARTSTVYLDPTKGEINEVYVKEGASVKEGDKLFSYDSTQLEQQLESLHLKKKSTNLQIDHRNEQISDLESRISDAEDQDAPDSVIDPLKSQKDDLAFQNQLAQIELKQDALQIQQVQEQMDNQVVTSPISGVVQNVSEEPYNSQEPVVTIVSGQPYEIHGTLTEYDAVHVKPGQSVSIVPKALSGEEWKGTVADVGDTPVVQTQSVNTGQQQSVSSYPFTITLKDHTGEPRPGYHVNVKIIVKQHKNVPVVPFDAILTKGKHSYLFVVKNHKLDKQPIQTGFVEGEYKEVTKGLQAGDKIVLDPTDQLEEGMVIRHDQT